MRAQGTRAGASVPSVPWAAPVAHLPVSTQGVAELPRAAGRGNPACGCLRECRRAARGGRAFWVSPISVPEQKGGRDLLESPEDRGTRPYSLSLVVLPLVSESLTRTTMTPREGEQDRQGPSSQPSPVPRPALRGAERAGTPRGTGTEELVGQRRPRSGKGSARARESGLPDAGCVFRGSCIPAACA